MLIPSKFGDTYVGGGLSWEFLELLGRLDQDGNSLSFIFFLCLRSLSSSQTFKNIPGLSYFEWNKITAISCIERIFHGIFQEWLTADLCISLLNIIGIFHTVACTLRPVSNVQSIQGIFYKLLHKSTVAHEKNIPWNIRPLQLHSVSLWNILGIFCRLDCTPWVKVQRAESSRKLRNISEITS